MTTPNEPEDGAAPAKVSVPFRLGDGLFTRTERVRVDPENAVQWDERRWRDRP
ncbi:MAG: hypothetical protein JWO98_3499 [Frankiales bacterium]|jgi:hypothetical protein|nr:hypothetical protein [Frankiales bacterium]